MHCVSVGKTILESEPFILALGDLYKKKGGSRINHEQVFVFWTGCKHINRDVK